MSEPNSTNQSFYICHCGYPKDNHHFRHIFREIALVTTDGISFSFSASKFPAKTMYRCSTPNCTASRSIHGTQLLEHPYTEEKYTCRDINFILPMNTVCTYNNCNILLSNHKKVQTHHFHTIVNIDDKQENDIIRVQSEEDDDIKIKFSS